ncbi:MAG TPA: hypothetical protein VMF87_26580 [Streptosporangiaceae bacterium]|nr:hypothetical protein [Streptosporangiaceae bacterium]
MTDTKACLDFIESQMRQIQYIAVTASTIAPAQDWLSGYTGPVSGTFTLSGVSYATQPGEPRSPATYIGLEVQSWVITDTEYLIARQPARADHAFAFPSTRPGRKMFVLYDIADQTPIAVHVPVTGNVRSYLVAAGQPGYGTAFAYQSYLYDQAMCLVAAIAAGRAAMARQLLTGLLRFQTASGRNAGGFMLSGRQLSPDYGDPVYRTGAHAIATYALLAYMHAYPDDDDDYRAAALSALGWMSKQKAVSGAQAGLFRGGEGAYDAPGETLDCAAKITGCATEHQFDVWHAFVKAALVLRDDGWSDNAAELADAIWNVLYDPARRRFYQGYEPGSGPDTGDPLDMHSWAAIWADRCGWPDVARAVLNDAALAPFEVSQDGIAGYQPEYASDPSGDYPGATPTIWSEGTFFTAYAFGRLGQAEVADAIIAGIDPAQQPDGSFAYCSVHDPAYELTPSQCVIGPAWAILAGLGAGIWDESPSAARPRGAGLV